MIDVKTMTMREVAAYMRWVLFGATYQGARVPAVTRLPGLPRESDKRAAR